MLNNVLTIILGTVPLLGTILWNLIELKDFKREIREEFRLIRVELKDIGKEISGIKERDRLVK
jgi:hypothetical protein